MNLWGVATKPRTPQEVGAIVRQRRVELGLRQEGLDGVSSMTVRQIEQGTASPSGRGITRVALMRALGWPPDALDRLAAGEDPKHLAPDSEPPTQPAGLSGRWDDLTDEQKATINAVIDQLADS